jgi:hypothetical protein
MEEDIEVADVEAGENEYLYVFTFVVLLPFPTSTKMLSEIFAFCGSSRKPSLNKLLRFLKSIIPTNKSFGCIMTVAKATRLTF